MESLCFLFSSALSQNRRRLAGVAFVILCSPHSECCCCTYIPAHSGYIMYSHTRATHNFAWKNGSCALATLWGCRLTMIKSRSRKKLWFSLSLSLSRSASRSAAIFRFQFFFCVCPCVCECWCRCHVAWSKRARNCNILPRIAYSSGMTSIYNLHSCEAYMRQIMLYICWTSVFRTQWQRVENASHWKVQN